MKRHNNHLLALLGLTLSMLVLTACGPSSQKQEGGIQSPAIEENAAEELTAADTGVVARSSFTFPYLGFSVRLPQALQDQVNDRTLYMGADESLSSDGSAVAYSQLTWHVMTEAQRTEVIPAKPEALQAWVDSLAPVAVLGAYDEASAAQVEELTGLPTHTTLGEQAGFRYILSLDEAQPTAAAFGELTLKQYEPSPLFPGDSSLTLRKEALTNVGTFTMADLEGNLYTEELFAENELTLVNLFATWCNPCVREIPELEELRHQMADRGVGVIGITLDGVDQYGQPDPTALSIAKELAKKTGATFPFLIPDGSAMNMRLVGVTSVPETFFVDSQGNLVGEVYLGARSLADWTAIVEAELANLKEA